MHFRWFNEVLLALGPSLLQASEVGVPTHYQLPSFLPGCSQGQEADRGLRGKLTPGWDWGSRWCQEEAHRPAPRMAAQMKAMQSPASPRILNPAFT